MATVKEAVQLLKDFAPEEHQYKKEYDNIGLMVGDENAQVNKIMCCLDVTEDVIDEAIESGANLIIGHHPFIYYPIKNINTNTVQGRKILKAVKNDIAIYAAHTNLDFVKDGINDYMCAMLGLRNLVPLDPYIDADAGFGRVGELSNKIYCSAFKAEIEKVFQDKYVRLIGDPKAQVKRVAVINGGGGGELSYVDMALSMGADCLITGDVKHHVAVYAKENNLVLIEPQHYTMEHAYISRLVQVLKIEAKSSKLNIEILQSLREKNPRA